MVKMIIDGIDIEVPENITIMKAAKMAGIEIPHLCFRSEERRVGKEC